MTPLVSATWLAAQLDDPNLVVIAYESPDPHKPGHIVVVRPSLKTDAQLEEDGPEIAQAGGTNHNDSIARLSFRSHPGAWPDQVKVYAHSVPDPATK